eukprot:PhM_4_TR12420/c0_g1_i1/m.86812
MRRFGGGLASQTRFSSLASLRPTCSLGAATVGSSHILTSSNGTSGVSTAGLYSFCRRGAVMGKGKFAKNTPIPTPNPDQAKGSIEEAVFMYSTKENADPRVSQDPTFARKAFYVWLGRLWGDKPLRLMVILCFTAIFGTYYYFDYSRSYMLSTNGLIGPKWKNHKSRLTVVLDLDETIVSYGDKAYRLRASLVQRPYLAELLDYLSEIDAEVIVWNASSERYLRDALVQIDPLGTRITRTIARDTVWYTNDAYYEKNVVWLNRNLADTIIIENRPLSVRGCNYNALLVPDFIRGEYMESGQDYPANDYALRDVKKVIEDLESTGISVPLYLADRKVRRKEVQEIPCHHGIRQLPDELAKGTFFYVADKFIVEEEAAYRGAVILPD